MNITRFLGLAKNSTTGSRPVQRVTLDCGRSVIGVLYDSANERVPAGAWPVSPSTTQWVLKAR